jgi:predicted Zn-dependent peptidase
MLNLRRGGVIAFYSASLPYRREATAFRNINETLAKLGEFEWLTEDSLASAKRKLASWQLRSAYFADGRADAIGRAFWFHGDEMTAFRSTARLRDVTAGDVRAVFEKYLAQARPVRLYIKPEHVPVMVRLFGWLYPLVKR